MPALCLQPGPPSKSKWYYENEIKSITYADISIVDGVGIIIIENLRITRPTEPQDSLLQIDFAMDNMAETRIHGVVYCNSFPHTSSRLTRFYNCVVDSYSLPSETSCGSLYFREYLEKLGRS
jgi:hypothetical protein